MATPKLEVQEYKATRDVNIGFIISDVQMLLIDTYSTGSWPPLENGLHLMILNKPIRPPFNTPYFSIASYV